MKESRPVRCNGWYGVRGGGIGLLLHLPLGDRWGGWLAPRRDRFTPREDSRYLLQKVVWPSGLVWVGVETRKSVAGPGFRPRTVQRVASHYTVSIFWREFVLRMKAELFSETSPAIYGLHGVSIVSTAVLNCGFLLRACLVRIQWQQIAIIQR